MRSPSGRIDIVADSDQWRIYIDGQFVADGEGDAAHVATLERLVGEHAGDVAVELAEAARYWRAQAGAA